VELGLLIQTWFCQLIGCRGKTLVQGPGGHRAGRPNTPNSPRPGIRLLKRRRGTRNKPSPQLRRHRGSAQIGDWSPSRSCSSDRSGTKEVSLRVSMYFRLEGAYRGKVQHVPPNWDFTVEFSLKPLTLRQSKTVGRGEFAADKNTHAARAADTKDAR